MGRGATSRNRQPRPAALLLAVVLAAVVLAALVLGGCSPRSAPPTPPENPRRPTITVVSFDFTESRVLAQLYAQAMRAKGYPVQVIEGLGPREIVQPALEQGRVDFVPGYL